MSDTKHPLEGFTVDDIRRLAGDPLVALGRALAPHVNAGLFAIKAAPKAKPGPDSYCPGCGELSSWAPDLCPECLAVSAHL